MGKNSGHTEDLIKWWLEAGDTGAHPLDVEALSSYSAPEERKLHTDKHTAIPYIGNLFEAKLFIVMLNPGYNFDEQSKDEAHEREAMVNCLRQKTTDNFWPLTIGPRSDGKSPGSRTYWRSIFRSYVIANGGDESLYQQIAKRICVVQLVPYHSQKSPGSQTHSLPSARRMADWVITEAKQGKRPVLIFRGWGHLDSNLNQKRPNWSHEPFIGKSFLRRPSFNPSGKVSNIAARLLSQALAL